MENKEKLKKLDYARLFGAGTDLFKSYHRSLIVRNILKSIGTNTSKDSDWFCTVANGLTTMEISEMYDKIMDPEHRKALASSRNFRTPPELGDEDSDDVLRYLSRDIVRRRKMWRIVEKYYDQHLEIYRKLLAKTDRTRSATEIRFAEMREMFELSELEMNAVITVFLSDTRFMDLGDFDIGHFSHGEKVTALSRALGVPEIEITEMLNDDRNIRKYGLMDEDLDLDHTFLSYLSGISSKPLAERFWCEYKGEALPWNFHGKLAEKYGEVLKTMIRTKKADTGLSVLLYGVHGAGKTSFAASLAHDMGKKLYFIAQNDDDKHHMSYTPAFRYAALAVAQKQLDVENCILVVDECDKLVENTGIGGSIFARLLGSSPAGSRDGEVKGQLNSVIDQNHHTILWICNSQQEAIDPSSRRRFDYNIFFDELSASAREHIWNNALNFYHSEGRLSDAFITRVSSRYAVNPGGISVAVKNAAAVCENGDNAAFEKNVMTFLKAHCSLLGIAESPAEQLEPARDYSLDGLNIRSGIKLPRLIEVCRNFLAERETAGIGRDQPRLNLLLFGVPGAGKTEFVKYLAKQLGKKLLVRNANDLLDCYVGMTEQRIAATFAEAEANDQILFIDEGDSMLCARESAHHRWEVSQVNTLLSEMEKFRGIFIVGTNLIQKLDPAAMRRFSFRLHFDYLTDEGKEIFFRTYFTKPMGMAELTDDERGQLHRIGNLTPSDFRNTRQQFFYLKDNDLHNSEIIDALAAEVAGKTSGGSYRGLGEIVNKMGF